MEKHLPFYQQLKHERNRRGWSQADIAEKLGIDPKTVNRWESGKRRLPRPYHRQMLCELFGKNAEELGLVEDEEVDASNFPLHRTLFREDWGEAPHVENFYGRDKELDALRKWVVDDHCRIVAVLGMGGVGKTTLAAEVAEQVKKAFEYVFWRSLQNAPPLEHILKQCIQFVSDQQRVDLPDSLDDLILLLIQHLRNQRCLLVLDNAESILQAGQRVGQYREGYEGYGTLVQRIGEAQHISCLLLTSREKPKEVALLEGKTLPVRSLSLLGMGYIEGRELLKDKELFGSNKQWATLVKLYSGNPLALKLVSEHIEGIFEGKLARFLEEEEIAFGDINDLLDQQFHRLSMREQMILYWLAIEREAVSLANMRENFVGRVSKGALLEALNSLQRRSLIETRGSARFTLQPVIMEYVTNRLTEQACKEFAGATVEIWTNYALMKAQAKDYVRDSQVRLILGPVAEQLLDTLGKDSIEQKLRGLLNTQRQMQPQQHSYLAGNALNLLVHLRHDLRSSDFSSLMIRQAYLQNVALPDVNFALAHFEASTFTNTFGNILSVAFSLDGELLAIGTATHDIWIYQVLTGTQILICHGHTDGVWSVAYSSDMRTLASSSDDQTIRLWDVSTGHCLKTLYEHTNRVRSVAFSPDGKVLASSSEDETIRLWDVSTGHCLKTLYEHTNRIWSVAFSPDGKVLASGSDDQTIRLWDVSTDHCLKILHGHTSGIRSVAFSPDNTMLASGSDDQTIRLWDVSTGHCFEVLYGHTDRLWSVTFSPDGNVLASGGEDQTIRLWDAHSRRYLKMLQHHTQGIRSIAFSPDRQTLASGGDDQTVRLWDVGTGYCLKTLQGYTNRIRSIAFAPGGETLASGGEDQTIRLWNVNTGHCFYMLQDCIHPIRSIVFSSDGHIIASSGDDQIIRLWDVSSGRCLSTLQGNTNWVWSVAFSPDRQTLASGGEDQAVRLWNVSSSHCLSTLHGHTSWVRSVAFSPNGRTIASGSDDQTIRLWETNTGHCLHTLEGHTGRIRSVAFSLNGQTLASGSEDQTVRLWNADTGRCFYTLQGHTNWVRSIAFSTDGKVLASGSDDQTIKLWDVSTGRCLHTLRGHVNRVRSVTFSSDGYTLASGSDDGTIKLWDTQTTDCLKTLISERPYERMNITDVSGLTGAQKATLKLLGAIED